MPAIALDYFLPADVYGDDPLTPEIEPVIPFALGVRAKNNGGGTARNLRIDSAQPRIVENAQGLLIGFAIEASEVNGNPGTNSLKVALGDIAPNRSANARWIMSCTLSGKFVDFQAAFSHADELGGQLTSLITQAVPHLLVRDVLVDLPGRDGIRDFLAADGDILRVYESEGTDTAAVDQSGMTALTLNGLSANLAAPATAGFFFAKLNDPFGGTKALADAVRSDGKRIKPDNVRLSRTFVKGAGWRYFVNLFDANSPGGYTLVFAEPSANPQAPVLALVAVAMSGVAAMAWSANFSERKKTSAAPSAALGARKKTGRMFSRRLFKISFWTPMERIPAAREATPTSAPVPARLPWVAWKSATPSPMAALAERTA